MRSEPQYSNVAAHHFVRDLATGPLSNRCACRWEFAEEQPEDETIRAELGEVETESGSSDPTNFDFYSHQQVRFRKAYRCTLFYNLNPTVLPRQTADSNAFVSRWGFWYVRTVLDRRLRISLRPS